MHINLAVLRTTMFLMTSLCTIASEADGDKDESWQLVWSDEFNQDGKPESKNWKYETGFVRHKEAQWYQPQNAWCEDGLLVIEARKESVRNSNFVTGSKDWKESRSHATHTSASLRTEGLRSWKFGRFEMRGKIDIRSGMWPTFWTMGVNGEWPSCGEVDIMEFYQRHLLANVAWATEARWVPHWDSVKKAIKDFDDPDWSNKFHIWRMDWGESSINIYLDGKLVNHTDLNRTLNGRQPPKNPFHQPHFILLNLAIGGANGGDHKLTRFPARFEIDYVRVYQTR